MADKATAHFNNDLFDRLGFLGDVLVPLLPSAAVRALSCTCHSWRKAVQHRMTQLAPKSELAMPFVAGCCRLQHLTLSRMRPAPSTARTGQESHVAPSLLSHVSQLTQLTHLDLSQDLTAAWMGQAVQVAADDLAHLTGCSALRVLNLAYNPWLGEAHSLCPLIQLPALVHLNLSIAGTTRPVSAQAWLVLGALTGLQVLNISGWSRCFLEPQQHVTVDVHEAGAAAAQAMAAPPAAVPAPAPAEAAGGVVDSGSSSSHMGCAIGRLVPRLSGICLGSCFCSAAAASGGGPAAFVGAAAGPDVAVVGSVALTTTAATTTPRTAQASRGSHTSGGLYPAPLHWLSHLTALRELVTAEWAEPPTSTGLAALQRLPQLTAWDIRCCDPQPAPAFLLHQHQQLGQVAAGGSSRQPASLLDWLQGTSHWQQQQQPLPCAAPGGLIAAPAPAPEAPAPAGLFTSLQRLCCAGLEHLTFDEGLWAPLSHLRQLNVSACTGFRGLGLCQLTALEELVASDSLQLDYDALQMLLLSAKQLQRLDLQRCIVILHTDGRTAEQLRSGTYQPPVAAAKHKQQQGQQGLAGSGSRRDVAGVPAADDTSDRAGLAPAKSGGSKAAGCGGLQELLMSECQLALEGAAWQQVVPGPYALQPCELLYHLVLFASQQLQHLRALFWDRADAVLASHVLSEAVPSAKHLTHLSFSGCSLPDDPSRCLQGIAAATNLRVLDLNNTGFSRHGYASLCGTNPTVSLLAAVAGMRLQQLKLAGWRFFFASFKPLAGLSDCLGLLDLSRARDVTDNTLWSLTHLTGLTWLSISSTSISNAQIFSLIFTHLSNLQHLDLSSVTAFTARSLPSLLCLPQLTFLDMRGTQAALDAAAVSILVQLSECRHLAVSLGHLDAAAGGRGAPFTRQQWRLLPHQDGSNDPSAAEDSVPDAQAAVGCAGDTGSSGVGFEEYEYLGQLGRAQSLRQLVLGDSTPRLSEYCRQLLPPWIDVR